MNQDIRKIDVTLVKEDPEHFLVFSLNDEIKVSLTSEQGQIELKNLFLRVLTQLLNGPVAFEFKDNPEYNTGLYIDVCKEYLTELNREIGQVYYRIPDRLKNNIKDAD